MASLAAHDGKLRVLFTDAGGRRRSVYLGRMDRAQAETIRGHVEALARCVETGTLPPRPTARWLDGLGERMIGKLVRAGLIEPPRVVERHTIGELAELYLSRSGVREATRRTYNQATASLLAHFGPDRPLESVSRSDADDWAVWLRDQPLAPATANKRIRVARQIFGRAVRWGWLSDNPFLGVRSGSESNPDRSLYIDRQTFARVLEACPDTQWRAILALSRFAGLRCPTETAALHWRDVRWDTGRLVVRSSKTADGPSAGVRVVPLAPELRSILWELFEQAEPGADRVVPRVCDGSVNLRTMARRIILDAGVSPWPRTLHNLRASCGTDWSERFPIKAVATWMGHSPKIAIEHYLHVRESHLDAAAGLAECAPERAPSAHIPAQQIPAAASGQQQQRAQGPEKRGFMPNAAGNCRNPQSLQMTPTGSDSDRYLPSETAFPAQECAPECARGQTPAVRAILAWLTGPRAAQGCMAFQFPEDS